MNLSKGFPFSKDNLIEFHIGSLSAPQDLTRGVGCSRWRQHHLRESQQWRSMRSASVSRWIGCVPNDAFMVLSLCFDFACVFGCRLLNLDSHGPHVSFARHIDRPKSPSHGQRNPAHREANGTQNLWVLHLCMRNFYMANWCNIVS